MVLSADIGVFPFDEQDARTAGDLRARLKSLGRPIGPFDLLIAAQALRMGATMVSNQPPYTVAEIAISIAQQYRESTSSVRNPGRALQGRKLLTLSEVAARRRELRCASTQRWLWRPST